MKQTLEGRHVTGNLVAAEAQSGHRRGHRLAGREWRDVEQGATNGPGGDGHDHRLANRSRDSQDQGGDDSGHAGGEHRAERRLRPLPRRARTTLHGGKAVRGKARNASSVTEAMIGTVSTPTAIPAVVPAGGVDAPLVFQGLPPGITARATPARVRVYPAGAQPPAFPPADSQPRAAP